MNLLDGNERSDGTRSTEADVNFSLLLAEGKSDGNTEQMEPPLLQLTKLISRTLLRSKVIFTRHFFPSIDCTRGFRGLWQLVIYYSKNLKNVENKTVVYHEKEAENDDGDRDSERHRAHSGFPEVTRYYSNAQGREGMDSAHPRRALPG